MKSRTHAVGSRTWPARAGAAVVLMGAVLGSSAAAVRPGTAVVTPPPPVKCDKATGPFHVSGIRMVNKHGKVFIPYGTTVTGLAPDPGQAPAVGSAEMQITGAFNYWCVNTVRLQVSQYDLVGPDGKSFSGPYLTDIKTVVRFAEKLGLVVVLSDQTETSGKEPAPTVATRVFWKHLTTLYGTRPQVIFDLFNEPRVDVGTSTSGQIAETWNIWQHGGTYHGVRYLGMENLAVDLHNDGARVLFWVEGPYSASTLGEVSSHLVGLPGQVVYDIHHPAAPHDVKAWDHDFGYLVHRRIAAVVDGEWTNYANDTSECWKLAPTQVPSYLRYLHTLGVGMTVWTLKWPVMLAVKSTWEPWVPTTFGKWKCQRDLDQGAGLDVMNWYKLRNGAS